MSPPHTASLDGGRSRRETLGLLALARTLLALILMGVSGSAYAQRPEPPPPGGLVERHAERLGLRGESLERVQQSIRTSGERHRVISEELREARSTLRELLSRPSPDAARVLEQAEVLGRIETRLEKNRLEAILEIRALLTPAQRDELVRILDERRAPGRRGRGPLRRCGRDLARHCAGDLSGPERLACLAEHWEDLSDRCRSLFADGEDRAPGPR